MPRSITRIAYMGLLLIGAVAIVYALFAGAGGPPSANTLERFAEGDLARLDVSQAGEPVPTAPFRSPDGELLTFEAFAGKIILVNYWATWCGPCEREMPHLGALKTARAGADFDVITISLDDLDQQAYAARRLNELTGLEMPNYYAPPEEWAVMYGAGVSVFPTTIIYDAQGLEIARVTGEADWSEGIALALVDEVLGR